MGIQNIQEDLKQIIEAVELLPERFQDKAFELLLKHSLSISTDSVSMVPSGATTARPRVDERPDDFRPTLSASKELRGLLARTGLSESDIGNLIDVDQVPPELRQYPRTNTKAQGQIQIALLSALLSAVAGRSLEVDPTAVRETCKAFGYYDEANFATTFRKNSKLFTGPLRAGDPPRRLSLEGERQLANLVRDLLRQSNV